MKKIITLVLMTVITILLVACIGIATDNKNGNLKSVEASRMMQTTKSKTDDNNFNIDVSIRIKVVLDKNVKNIDPNIIRAARQSLFLMYCDRAKFSHFKRVDVDETMDINEVIDKGNQTWEVRYNKNDAGYSKVRVEKQKDGSFKGYITYGNVCDISGTTY